MMCLFHYIVDGTLKLYSVSQDKQLHSCSPSSMVRFCSIVIQCAAILISHTPIALPICPSLPYRS